MAYLVIAYPQITDKDHTWIQKHRRQFDQRFFNIVDPHITLVFAVNDIDETTFIEEVRQRLEGVHRFAFEMRVATINRDLSGAYYHEFLVPDTGFSDFVKLHDQLYSGLLRPHLRLDIDYIPHIGIGNGEDVTQIKQRVDTLNSTQIDIRGEITALDVIEFADGKVRTIERISLL